MARSKQVQAFIDRLEARIERGLRECAATHAGLLRQEVGAKQTTPVGSHKRHGDIYRGETVERSVAGEYPRREFGNLVQSVRFNYSPKEKCARSGVTEDGLSIFFLEFGHHPVSGEKYDRLGMVRLYEDNRALLASVFKQAFEVGA